MLGQGLLVRRDRAADGRAAGQILVPPRRRRCSSRSRRNGRRRLTSSALTGTAGPGAGARALRSVVVLEVVTVPRPVETIAAPVPRTMVAARTLRAKDQKLRSRHTLWVPLSASRKTHASSLPDAAAAATMDTMPRDRRWPGELPSAGSGDPQIAPVAPSDVVPGVNGRGKYARAGSIGPSRPARRVGSQSCGRTVSGFRRRRLSASAAVPPDRAGRAGRSTSRADLPRPAMAWASVCGGSRIQVWSARPSPSSQARWTTVVARLANVAHDGTISRVTITTSCGSRRCPADGTGDRGCPILIHGRTSRTRR